MKTSTATKLEIYKSLVHSHKVTLLLVSHDVKVPRPVWTSKEGNETDDSMHEQAGLKVSK